MKEFKIEIDEEGITGHVVMSVPTMKERLKIMKDIDYKEGGDQVEMGLKIMGYAEDAIVGVDVMCGDVHVTKPEELGYYDFANKILNKVSPFVLNGIPSGKN